MTYFPVQKPLQQSEILHREIGILPPPNYINRRNVSFVAEVMTYTWVALSISRYAIDYARETQGDGPVVENLDKVVKVLDTTRIFSVVNILTYLPLLVKSVKKTIRKEGIHRLDNALQSIFCLRSMLAHCKNFIIALDGVQISQMLSTIGLEPVFKVALTSTQYLAITCFGLSFFNLALSFRNHSKITVFRDELEQYYGNLTSDNANLAQDYQKFIRFLDSKKACSLTKHLRINGQALKCRLGDLQNITDQETILKVVESIKGKVALEIRNHRAAIVADAIAIIASGLFVASFALPLGYILSAAAISIYVGILVTRKISEYQLENQFGLMVRDESSPFYTKEDWPDFSTKEIGAGARLNDFMKWLFALQTYHTEEKPYTTRDDYTLEDYNKYYSPSVRR